MTYLMRLKAKIFEKPLLQEPSKPSKSPFEGFEGDQGGHFFDNAVAPAVFVEGFAELWRACPDHVEPDRWRAARHDARRFLETWGDQAAALGWTADDLFGLHPEAPMRRCDAIGLVWLLQGRPVLVLTEDAATIGASGGTRLRFPRMGQAMSRLAKM
jgi:hypothetical protein